MKFLEGKMKFLAIKLSALQSELDISKKIFIQASAEVDRMFKEKYFPEVPPEPKKTEEPTVPATDAEEKEDSEPNKEQEQQDHPEQQKQKEKDPEEIIQHAPPNVDPEVKSLFKKVAKKVHPDKLESLEEGFEKQRKSALYQKAMKAVDDNDLLLLSDIAMELGIQPPDISEEQLKKTENKIIAIKRELSHIESTIVWHWFFCSNAEQKDAILKQLFELMYEQQKQQNSRS